MKKTKNKKNNNNSFQQKKEAEKKVEKNYAEKEIIRYTKNYTNEHICKQIEENCIMFRILMGMLAFAFLLILISCIRAFADIYPKVSLYLWISKLRNNHAVGPVFGTTFIILAGVGIHEFDSFNMIKHIRPLCSGKRYSASRIDELANHPETIWLKEAGVFGFTPDYTIYQPSDSKSLVKSILKERNLDEKTYNIPRALIPEAREGDTVEITVSGRVPSKGAESPREIFERLRQNSRKKE